VAPASGSSSVAGAVAKFALSGLVVVALLGVAAVFVFIRIGRTEAVADARSLTALAGRGIVQPALTPGILTGDATSLRAVDRVVRRHVLQGAVVRVKIWRADGTIVYSDEPRLVGTRYALGADEQEAIRSGAVHAEVSDLSKPENRFERLQKKLLEVYLPIRIGGGPRVLYEEYLRYSSVAASANGVWRDFAPVLIAALVVLELVQVPLAWSLARRLRERQREREQLLQQAVDASDAERRRIAADLHDGLVQDLAGISFELAAEAERGGPAADGLRRAAAVTRACVRQLRTLLLQIYPPSLRDAGLEAALADLLAPAATRGLRTELRVDPLLDEMGPLPGETEELLFRAAQEALRNVVAHSRATSVEVSVARRNGSVELRVVDDGRGFDPDEAARRRSAGHVGLDLLAALARDAGGVLEVGAANGASNGAGPRGGTTVRLEVPVR
jgi:signal transduction histidine kinase